LSLRGTVAELRRIGEQTNDTAVREHAAALLARIARHGAGRAGHPDRWWGLAERTTNETPVRPVDEPLVLSGSQMSSLTDCPLRWFLGHEVRGGQGTTAAQGFGSIVHALAADTARRGVVPDPEQMAERLDDVWDALGYPDWISARERGAAQLALARYAQWHVANARTLVAVEHPFDVTFDVDGQAVQITGKFDRVEQSEDGIHVIDLKTSKRKADGVETHAQLGTYQVAIDAGAVSALVDGGAAGAELVQLRNDADSKSPGVPLVQSQAGPVPDEPFFAIDQLRRAVRHIAEENFAATENANCKYCEFRALCPTTDAGSTILTGREEGSS
jgi:RecB family exonuclease